MLFLEKTRRQGVAAAILLIYIIPIVLGLFFTPPAIKSDETSQCLSAGQAVAAAEAMEADQGYQPAEISVLSAGDEPMPDNNSFGVPKNPPAGPEQKLIALTFDDGPGKYTESLLDALRERDVKVSFFVIGERIEKYPGILKRMADDGHEIGNHTMTHPYGIGISPKRMRRELKQCSRLIKKHTDQTPRLMRFPYGAMDKLSRREAKEQGLVSILWSVDTEDYRLKNVKKIIKKAYQPQPYGVQDGAIVLMHDIHKASVKAAVVIIDRLIGEGYRIVTVSEMFEARGKKLKPGKSYSSAAKE
ncbi:MAG: polysaccharide deacetylase family protein [Oscillospiraceae bacterium]|nr:polysaccharide deacetylase family protein [Oscillospiraceae bacterium]